MMFLVRNKFSLNRGPNPYMSFKEGKLYSHDDLRGAEGTGLGETMEGMLNYLETGKYIILLKSIEIHKLLKTLLFRKIR